MTAEPTETRTERRKAASRASLLKAAQAYMAEGNTGVAVLDITKRADVGLGTFYNHFSSKEELFDAAVENAMEVHAALLDLLVPEDEDPAHVFAQRFRLTGRMHRLEPELSKVVLNRGVSLMSSQLGFTPRARRDVERAMASGRFFALDVEIAMALVFGAALALGQLLHSQPERDDAQAADAATAALLRMLGMSDAEAAEIATSALPGLPDDLGDTTEPRSA